MATARQEITCLAFSSIFLAKSAGGGIFAYKT
nr:MAG TPA: hypothetical protein [Caudoviricetes sp.]DAS26249.1 MAG TPA: hypothetical protein [Caudoviricetes sp.]